MHLKEHHSKTALHQKSESRGKKNRLLPKEQQFDSWLHKNKTEIQKTVELQYNFNVLRENPQPRILYTAKVSLV